MFRFRWVVEQLFNVVIKISRANVIETDFVVVVVVVLCLLCVTFRDVKQSASRLSILSRGRW